MPTLDTSRYESFAQARAKGARLALLDTARPRGFMAGVRRQDQSDIIDEFGRLARAAGAVHA